MTANGMICPCPLKMAMAERFFDRRSKRMTLPMTNTGCQWTKMACNLLGLIPSWPSGPNPCSALSSDFAIPAKFPSLSPVILFDQEELLEQYSAGRNWKLALPPGWIELAPFSRQYCLAQEGHPQAYARYIVPDKLTVTIKICFLPKSAERNHPRFL